MSRSRSLTFVFMRQRLILRVDAPQLQLKIPTRYPLISFEEHQQVIDYTQKAFFPKVVLQRDVKWSANLFILANCFTFLLL